MQHPVWREYSNHLQNTQAPVRTSIIINHNRPGHAAAENSRKERKTWQVYCVGKKQMSWGLTQSSPDRVPASEDCKILLAAVFVCLFSHYLYLCSWNTFCFDPELQKGAAMLDSSSQMKSRQKAGSWCNIHLCHASASHRSRTQTTKYMTAALGGHVFMQLSNLVLTG